jgi:hypothetical protein
LYAAGSWAIEACGWTSNSLPVKLTSVQKQMSCDVLLDNELISSLMPTLRKSESGTPFKNQSREGVPGVAAGECRLLWHWLAVAPADGGTSPCHRAPHRN